MFQIQSPVDKSWKIDEKFIDQHRSNWNDQYRQVSINLDLFRNQTKLINNNGQKIALTNIGQKLIYIDSKISLFCSSVFVITIQLSSFIPQNENRWYCKSWQSLFLLPMCGMFPAENCTGVLRSRRIEFFHWQYHLFSHCCKPFCTIIYPGTTASFFSDAT